MKDNTVKEFIEFAEKLKKEIEAGNISQDTRVRFLDNDDMPHSINMNCDIGLETFHEFDEDEECFTEDEDGEGIIIWLN